jgi:hypothetical protein
VLSEDTELRGVINNGVVVDAGAVVRVLGTLNGSVSVKSGTVLNDGTVNGSVHLASGTEVRVAGVLSGSTHIAEGGTAVVLRAGSLRGSLHNDGLLINDGTRGGTVQGSGSIEDRPGASVKQPNYMSADGVNATYIWS